MIFRGILLICLPIFSYAASKFGGCAKHPVVQNLDIERLMGRWYEITTYYTAATNHQCVVFDYSAMSNGGFKVQKRTKHGDKVTYIEGTVTFENPNSKEAKLIAKYNNTDSTEIFWVLDTDYENYAVVWTCYTYLWGMMNAPNAWVLGRVKPLPPKSRKIVDKIIIDRNLEHNVMQFYEDRCLLGKPSF